MDEVMTRNLGMALGLAVVLAGAGCGGGSSGGASGPDGRSADAAAERPALDGASESAPDAGPNDDGPADDGSADLPSPDGGEEGAPAALDGADEGGGAADGPGSPPAAACQPATPPGARVASAPWSFAGYMSSDWVLVTDGTRLAVAPTSGTGGPTVISEKATTAVGEGLDVSGYGSGGGVFVFVDNPTADDQGRSVGTLKAWSSGTGARVLTTRGRIWSTDQGPGTPYSQSNLLLFTDLSGGTPEAKLVALPSGTPQSLGEEMDEAIFSPGAAHYLVLARGGHIWVVDTSGGAPVDVDVGSDPLPSGDGLGLYFMRINGGDSGDLYHRPLSVDPAPTATMVAAGVIPGERQVVDGAAAIVLRRESGAIVRVPSPGAAEQVLVDTGARQLFPVLPGGASVLYSTTAPTDPPSPVDLRLAPVAGGPSRKIADAGIAWSFSWTTDGHDVIYQDPGTPEGNLGKVQVLDVANPQSTPVMIDAQGDFLAVPWDARHFLVLGAYDSVREAGRLFTYDAVSGTPTTIHGSVGRGGFSVAGTRVAYTVSGCGDADGLYVTELTATP